MCDDRFIPLDELNKYLPLGKIRHVQPKPLRELYLMTAYLTDEDRVALRVFCEERNIPLEFI